MTRRALVFALVTLVAIANVGVVVLGIARGQGNVAAWIGFSMTPYAIVGAVVALRRPGERLAWLFLANGTVASTGWFADSLAQLAYERDPSPGPIALAAVWYTEWFWIPMIFFTFVFTLLFFPSGSLPSPRWRPLFWFAVVSCAGMTMASWFQRKLEVTTGELRVDNPIGFLPVADVEEATAGAPVFLLLICALGALASVVTRFRRARGVERQQLKWVAYAATVLVVGFTVHGVVDEWLGGRNEAVDVALNSVVPVAAGVAILRYRLYDIDRIINRTLVYGALTAMIAGAYALVALASAALGARVAVFRNDLVVAGATLAVAAAFGPLRRRTQAFVDRRFYRSRYDAARTVEGFSARLRDSVELETLSADLLTTVNRTLQPAHASLWLRTEMREA